MEQRILISVLTHRYRLSPGAACISTGTSGNTASQLQIEFAPDQIVQDKYSSRLF